MLILALSTSGGIASAALYDTDRDILFEKRGAEGKTHSETIMPITDALLSENGVLAGDIDLFAADIGPGSFTGVRIGVCAANAMAMATGRPVAGVSSLVALRHNADREGSVCTLIDARNGNGYAARFLGDSCVLSPSPVVILDFVPSLPHHTLFIGDGAVISHELILKAMPTAEFLNGKSNVLTAKAVAKEALISYHKGEAKREVMPLYLRPSQAERLYGRG